MILHARRHTLAFDRPLIMGIVNFCADSFSGDGVENAEAALELARAHVRNGADIIDLGAESAGTKRAAISAQQETDRLCTFVEKFLASDIGGTCLSINTWRPEVVRAVLPMGGDILNDIGGLPSDENAQLCAKFGAALVIMHSVGEPKVPHTHVGYEDVMAALVSFFEKKIALAETAGLARESLILDPGIDFAKQQDDNLRIYRELRALEKFARPILLPVSRKTVIGETLGIADPAERDAGTIACVVCGFLRGASIFRVHHVRAAKQAMETIGAVCGEKREW